MRHSLASSAAVDYHNNFFLENLKLICKPLFDCFSITHFFYIHIQKDGHFVLLSHDPHIIQALSKPSVNYENIFFEKFYFDKNMDLDKYFWPMVKEDKYSNTHLINSLGLANGLNIVKKNNDNSLEFFIFATGPDNKSIYNTYLNYFSFFERFIFYFKIKAANIISRIQQDDKRFSSFYQSQMQRVMDQDILRQETLKFIRETCLRKYYVCKKDGVKTTLSKRQVQCLYKFAQGQTAKEVARDLNISYRTVQTHLNTIKEKIDAYTKSETLNCLSPELKMFLDTDQAFK